MITFNPTRLSSGITFGKTAEAQLSRSKTQNEYNECLDLMNKWANKGSKETNLLLSDIISIYNKRSILNSVPVEKRCEFINTALKAVYKGDNTDYNPIIQEIGRLLCFAPTDKQVEMNKVVTDSINTEYIGTANEAFKTLAEETGYFHRTNDWSNSIKQEALDYVTDRIIDVNTANTSNPKGANNALTGSVTALAQFYQSKTGPDKPKMVSTTKKIISNINPNHTQSARFLCRDLDNKLKYTFSYLDKNEQDEMHKLVDQKRTELG
jgi:hypothetical protein